MIIFFFENHQSKSESNPVSSRRGGRRATYARHRGREHRRKGWSSRVKPLRCQIPHTPSSWACSAGTEVRREGVTSGKEKIARLRVCVFHSVCLGIAGSIQVLVRGPTQVRSSQNCSCVAIKLFGIYKHTCIFATVCLFLNDIQSA